MVNSEFIKDISKAVVKSNLGGSQELPAGETPRRYEPAAGISKHNERIHRESAQMDKHGNLPFTFSKPYKAKAARSNAVSCDNCGHIHWGTVNTIGMICNHCDKYSSVSQIEG